MLNTQAFAELLRVLEDVKEMKKPFNMEVWEDTMDEGECGSPACAIGWACRDPFFISQEFTLRGGLPSFKGVQGFPAITYYFGISPAETEFLFHAYTYRNWPRVGVPVEVVIGRIKQFLKSHQTKDEIIP